MAGHHGEPIWCSGRGVVERADGWGRAGDVAPLGNVIISS